MAQGVQCGREAIVQPEPLKELSWFSRLAAHPWSSESQLELLSRIIFKQILQPGLTHIPGSGFMDGAHISVFPKVPQLT